MPNRKQCPVIIALVVIAIVAILWTAVSAVQRSASLARPHPQQISGVSLSEHLEQMALRDGLTEADAQRYVMYWSRQSDILNGAREPGPAKPVNPTYAPKEWVKAGKPMPGVPVFPKTQEELDQQAADKVAKVQLEGWAKDRTPLGHTPGP